MLLFTSLKYVSVAVAFDISVKLQYFGDKLDMIGLPVQVSIWCEKMKHQKR